MALRKRGSSWYGDDADDLAEEMRRYADRNGYPLSASYAPACPCGAAPRFGLAGDDGGGAVLTCRACSARRYVADAERYLSARCEDRECRCERSDFDVVVGAAFYEGSTDVRWWYVGGRCPKCKLLGVYVDWKDDGTPWEPALREPKAGRPAARARGTGGARSR